MRSMKIASVAAAAAMFLAIGATTADAQRGRHGGFYAGGHHGPAFRSHYRGHRGWWGPGIAGAVALGALATVPYYAARHYCDEVVGYDAWGRPVVANTCY